MRWPWQGKKDDEAGRIGRYEIVERIGAGGMAEAFRAVARGPGGYERQLIIKCILPELAADPQFISLFIAEAKILGMINHPNVVQVYDFGEQDGRHFLALEFLDGPSLEQVLDLLLRTRQWLSVPLAAYVAREICLGLSAAHRLCDPDGQPMHVVHRDATPSNVLTTSAGGIKLVDFGIARTGLPRAVTQTGSVKGKPAYLAPEQLRGGNIDARADLFTTGVVLHEMLVLESPFDDENPLATLYQVVEKKVPPPSRKRPEIPAGLDQIVLKALEKVPGNRFQSALEMADALAPFAVQGTGDGREDVAALVALWRRAQADNPSSPTSPTAPTAPLSR
jgi:eukaryotic-like serine/threonine-protein kinase